MTDQTILAAVSRITGLEFPDPRVEGKIALVKVLGRDFAYGFVGLFFLDVAWRITDVLIDFICAHILWLAWLGD